MNKGLPDFSVPRVLVVGDVMLDRYWYGDTERISPEAPVPVVHVQSIEERPGGAGNVALNIAALGGHASVVGLVGDDEAGRSLSERLRASGCHAQLVSLPEFPTVTKLRVMSRHQQLMRMDFEQDRAAVDTNALLRSFQSALQDTDCVVLSDYAKGALNDPAPFIESARKQDKTVIVDPKRSDFEAYRGASLVTPNLHEFEAVVGKCSDDAMISERGERLMHDCGLGGILITRSEHGMTLLRCGSEAVHLPAQARDVFDVTGAGDTVVAVFTMALASGLPMAQAAELANFAAGIVVGKLGTATVSREELSAALNPKMTSHASVVDEAKLQQLVQEARNNGERIVMTNGCFDLLHPGHVTYLEQAAALGERLVVAVNDDDSVKRLKGSGRPIVGLQDRMTVLAGLRSVDWVVSFSEDTPERLICETKPDVLVKGGDYQPSQIAGGDCVRQTGGEVVVLNYVNGHSTTALIDEMLKSAN